MKTRLKKILLLALILSVFTDIFAMKGKYTLNDQIPISSTNFTSWGAFTLALVNFGVEGPLELHVECDRNENTPVQFPEIAGVSSVNTISIYGHGYYLRVASTDGVILINGSDNLLIDSLKIQNSVTYINGIGIRIWNASDFNTIRNCEIEFTDSGKLALYHIAYIAFSDTINPFVRPSLSALGYNNKIINNRMYTRNPHSQGPAAGIIFIGEPGTYLSIPHNNTIIGNSIQNFYASGIMLDFFNGFQIISNDISRIGSDSAFLVNSLTGINAVNGISGNRQIRIDSNHIHSLPLKFNNFGSNTQTISGISIENIIGKVSMRFSVCGNAITDNWFNSSFKGINSIDGTYIDICNNLIEKNVGYESSLNIYGIVCQSNKGSYKMNGNKIQYCENAHEFIGIYNNSPELCDGIQEINSNVIENIIGMNIRLYGILSAGAIHTDSIHLIEIKGNLVHNLNTSTNYLYPLISTTKGYYLISDNVIENNQNVFTYGIIYNIYCYDPENVQILRNIVRNNHAANTYGETNDIKVQNAEYAFISSNLLYNNYGYNSSKGIYVLSSKSGNFKAEILQNTLLMNGDSALSSSHKTYPLIFDVKDQYKLDILGNIIDLRNVNSVYHYFNSETSANIQMNSYCNQNVKFLRYISNKDTFYSLKNWLNSNPNRGEFNIENGNFFNSDYSSRNYWNQDNVPTSASNAFDVYGNPRRNGKSDRGAVEYDGATGLRDLQNINLNSSYVYPNPLSRSSLIHLFNKNQNSRFEIFDMQGRLILKGDLQEGMNLISSDKLNFGLYKIILDNENNALSLLIQ